MKQLVFTGMVVTLTGCMQVDHCDDVVKAPTPASLEDYWQSKGPQSEMMSPDAIASLVVTKGGDTFDYRQWQRVIAQPGELMDRDNQIYNVTASLDVYPIEREDDTFPYDRMTLTRVGHLTPECEKTWAKARATGAVSARASVRWGSGGSIPAHQMHHQLTTAWLPSPTRSRYPRRR